MAVKVFLRARKKGITIRVEPAGRKACSGLRPSLKRAFVDDLLSGREFAFGIVEEEELPAVVEEVKEELHRLKEWCLTAGVKVAERKKKAGKL
jgi:hypothetical protein